MMFSFQTLARRLLYAMLPWYLLLAIGMTALQLAMQYFTVNQAVVSDLQSLGRTIAPGMTNAVWELDIPELKSMTKGGLENAIVTGIKIENEEGKTLVEDGGVLESMTLHQETVPLLYQSQRGEQRLVGYLKMYSSRNVVWERMKYASFGVVLNSVVMTAAFWLIFSWTIRFRLSKTVTRIARAVAAWGGKQDSSPIERIEYPYQDELGTLVSALNEGRMRLFDSMQKLNELNLNLENTVIVRTQEMQQARDAAEAASRAKGSFLANMSHEIRTPMNTIMGLTHLVLETPLAEKQRDYLQKVHKSSAALLSLLNDILDYSKIEAGHLDIEKTEFTLENCVQNASNLFTTGIEAKGLQLFVEIDPAVPQRLLGDPLRVEQILNNLIGNAIKFTEQGHIKVKVEVAELLGEQVRLRISVTDTGIGIAAEQTEKLFQAFTQADISVTRRFGGTGLGLAICKHLVGLMGGEISVSSTPGQGSTFSFSIVLGLPTTRHEEATTVQRPAIEAIQREHAKLDEIRGSHILLVEDNLLNQEVAKEFLGRAGAFVTLANNGQEAVELVQQQEFDAVLMDLHMPVMDGFEASRQIRALAGKESLPIIAMTAAAMPQDRIASLKAGMNAHVAKPFNPQELADCLHAHIQLSPQRRLADSATIQEESAPEDKAALVAALPEFNVQAALVRMHGNLILYRRLLDAFAQRHSNLANEIRRHQGNTDGALFAIAHALKSEAGNLGMDALSESATSLCAAINNPVTADLQGGAEHLASECESAIAHILALPPLGEAVAGSEKISADELQALLSTLTAQLEAKNFAAIQLAGKIEQQLAGSELGPAFQKVCRPTQELDFEAALTALREFISAR